MKQFESVLKPIAFGILTLSLQVTHAALSRVSVAQQQCLDGAGDGVAQRYAGDWQSSGEVSKPHYKLSLEPNSSGLFVLNKVDSKSSVHALCESDWMNLSTLTCKGEVAHLQGVHKKPPKGVQYRALIDIECHQSGPVLHERAAMVNFSLPKSQVVLSQNVTDYIRPPSPNQRVAAVDGAEASRSERSPHSAHALSEQSICRQKLAKSDVKREAIDHWVRSTGAESAELVLRSSKGGVVIYDSFEAETRFKASCEPDWTDMNSLVCSGTATKELEGKAGEVARFNSRISLDCDSMGNLELHENFALFRAKTEGRENADILRGNVVFRQLR